MSGIEDFRIHLSWRTHPKRAKLQRRLGRDGVMAIIDIWGWCAANPLHRDGNLRGMTAEDIAIAADYAGDADALVSTLVDVRLLDLGDDGYSLHDYLDWNPWVGGSFARINSARMNAFRRHHEDGRHAGRVVSGCPLCDSHANGSAAAHANTDSALRDDAKRIAPTPTPTPIPLTQHVRNHHDRPREPERPPPERECAIVPADTGPDMQRIEKRGYSRFGSLYGKGATAIRALLPIADAEIDDAMKSPGKSWVYAADVIRSAREKPTHANGTRAPPRKRIQSEEIHIDPKELTPSENRSPPSSP